MNEQNAGKRRIGVVTTSRADYSHLYWPLRELAAHPEVELGVIALAGHLSPEFGSTLKEIERDGFPIRARIECLLSSDTDTGMAKTIGVAILGLADALTTWRPDLLLLIANRHEMLAPASAALALRIPVAHIEGGEVSQGAIDDQVRNALTKLAHIHFTSTPTARLRVIAMGEEPWRVHHAGAPSLDHLSRSKLLDRAALEARLGITLAQPTLLAAYHPVTILKDTTAEADALFTALAQAPGQLLFVYPNADAGSYGLIERTKALAKTRGGDAHLCQPRRHHVLEPAGAGGRHGGQLVQRHHGGGLLRSAHGERGHAPAGTRTGPQCDRRASGNCCNPRCAQAGSLSGAAKGHDGYGEPVRRRHGGRHHCPRPHHSAARRPAYQAARTIA